MDNSYKKKSAIWFAFVFGAFGFAAWLHGGLDARYAIALIGLCFTCELIDSGLGMGYGTILTPRLLLIGYEAQDIVPTMLFSELLSGFAAAYFHNEIKNVDLSFRGGDLLPATILAGGSFTGVSVGVLVAVNISEDTLTTLIGCVILLSGLVVVLLSRKVIKYRR